MASVKDLGNGKFKITVSAGFDSDGERIRRFKTVKVKSEKAAQREANKFEAEVLEGRYIEPTHYSFAEYVEKVWRPDAERKLAVKTMFHFNKMIDSRIKGAIGNVQLEKITPVTIENFYNTLREPITRERKLKNGTIKKNTYTLSEVTIRHHHRLINLILQSAFRKGLIKENPCSRVDAPKPKKKELSIYTEDQIGALVEALDNAGLKFKTCVHIALAGGLRLGEVLGLEWQDVDYDNSAITVVRTSQYLPGKGIFTKEPKNETSKRLVSLPAPVMALIKSLEIEQKKRRLKLANKWEGSNRLLTTETGGPMHPHSPTKWFHKFLEENKLPPLPFHGLRHTSASFLISCGQDVVTVSKRLGHSNTSTTLNIYSHGFRKRDEEAANKMEGLYSLGSKAKKAN